MDKKFCTIYDCEFDRYQKGVVADNIVYAIDDNGNQAPAREYICEYVDFGMVQFHTGYYDESGEYLEKKSSKWGYFQLSTGRVLIPPKYDYAGPFYDDRVMIEKNKKYGFIDLRGKVIVDFQFDDIGESKYFYIAHNTNIEKRSFGDHRIQFYTVKKYGQWGLMKGDFDVIMQFTEVEEHI